MHQRFEDRRDPGVDAAADRRSVLWRRADQAAVAGLVAAGLVSLAAYWAVQVRGGRMIEIERADPRDVRFRVDINRATWPELAQLPGVGETLARRIVEWRERHGQYRQPSDLLDVPGVGPATLRGFEPCLLPIGDAHVARRDEVEQDDRP